MKTEKTKSTKMIETKKFDQDEEKKLLILDKSIVFYSEDKRDIRKFLD